jgi:glycosyltransferase involved in cell wall biosynthesis
MEMADSELRSRRSALHRLRKALTVPRFLRAVDAFLTVGDCNEAYYLHYGAQRNQFRRSPYPIDSPLLSDRVGRRESIRAATRSALGLPADAFVAVIVGKLTARKRPEHLLEAVGIVNGASNGKMYALLAGDGPERARLESLASTTCPDAARFMGFVNLEQLPSAYLSADVLVHTSSEDPHPLAVGEGVYCGLPAVVSDRVGCVGPTDDVRLGANGFEYPFGDVSALAERLLRLRDDVPLRSSMAGRSLEIGRSRSLEASVKGFVDGVHLAMERASHRK